MYIILLYSREVLSCGMICLRGRLYEQCRKRALVFYGFDDTSVTKAGNRLSGEEKLK